MNYLSIMKVIPLLLALIPTLFLVAHCQRPRSMKKWQNHLQRWPRQRGMTKIKKRTLPPFEIDFSKMNEEGNKTQTDDFASSIGISGFSVSGKSETRPHDCKMRNKCRNRVGATSNQESYAGNRFSGGGCSSVGSAGNKNKAANIAIKAAEEAKSASDAQAGAAEAAARQVKTQLAEKAMAAAKAAEAALSGKQQILEQLEQEIHEAEIIVQEETDSLQVTHNNADASMLASKQAGLQLKTLTTAVNIAQENVANAETAAKGAAQEFNEKTKLVEAAKSRVELLLRQLSAARSDFVNTKKAAFQASSAAQEAKLKAARD